MRNEDPTATLLAAVRRALDGRADLGATGAPITLDRRPGRTRLRLPLRDRDGATLWLDLAEWRDPAGRLLTYHYGLVARRGDGRALYEGYHLHREQGGETLSHRTVRLAGVCVDWSLEPTARPLESALEALLAGAARRDCYQPAAALSPQAGETWRAFRRRKLAAARRRLSAAA